MSASRPAGLPVAMSASRWGRNLFISFTQLARRLAGHAMTEGYASAASVATRAWTVFPSPISSTDDDLALKKSGGDSARLVRP